ncbi:MAG: hypothetical protein ABL959_22110, partial [Pyrinomonadaceae bacterium]
MFKLSRSLKLSLVICLVTGVAAAFTLFSTGVTANDQPISQLISASQAGAPDVLPDDPETLREKAKALAAEHELATESFKAPDILSQDGPGTNLLFAGVDDVA